VNGELTRPNRVLVGNLARRRSGDHSEETLPLCLRECAAPPHSGAAAPRRIRRDEYRDGWRARARLAEGNIAAVLERVLIDPTIQRWFVATLPSHRVAHVHRTRVRTRPSGPSMSVGGLDANRLAKALSSLLQRPEGPEKSV
jgi:hypothetical protein